MSHPSAANYRPDRTNAQVGPELRLELRRLANLFLASSLTMALFLLWVFSIALSVTFIPRGVDVVWGGLLLAGLATTYVLAAFTMIRARRLGWLVLCLIPFTCVPAALAYAWTRRMELEHSVLADARPAPRQRRAGRRR